MQDDISQSTVKIDTPWKLGNAVKNSIAGLFGLATLEGCVYGFAYSYSAVMGIPESADFQLPQFGAAYYGLMGLMGALHFLVRSQAPSTARFGEALKDSAALMTKSAILGAASAGFYIGSANTPALIGPAFAGAAGLFLLSLRSCAVNPLVEKTEEVSTTLGAVKNIVRPLGYDQVEKVLVSFKEVVSEKLSRQKDSQPKVLPPKL